MKQVLDFFTWSLLGDYPISKLFLPLLILKAFNGICFYYIVFKNSTEQYFFANLGFNLSKGYITTIIAEFICIVFIFKLMQVWF